MLVERASFGRLFLWQLSLQLLECTDKHLVFIVGLRPCKQVPVEDFFYFLVCGFAIICIIKIHFPRIRQLREWLQPKTISINFYGRWRTCYVDILNMIIERPGKIHFPKPEMIEQPRPDLRSRFFFRCPQPPAVVFFRKWVFAAIVIAQRLAFKVIKRSCRRPYLHFISG